MPRWWDGQRWARPFRRGHSAAAVLLALGVSFAAATAIAVPAFTFDQTGKNGLPVGSGPFWPIPVLGACSFLLIWCAAVVRWFWPSRAPTAGLLPAGPLRAPTTWVGAVAFAEAVMAIVSAVVWTFLALGWNSSSTWRPPGMVSAMFVSLVGVPCALAAIAFGMAEQSRHGARASLAIGLAGGSIGLFFIGMLGAANGTT